jgi:hypothetical protein
LQSLTTADVKAIAITACVQPVHQQVLRRYVNFHQVQYNMDKLIEQLNPNVKIV